MQLSDRPSMIFMLNALRMSNFREQKRFFRPGSNCPINRNVANRKNNKRIGTPVFNLQNTCTVDGLNRRLKSRKTLRPSFPVQLSPCFSKYFSADEKTRHSSPKLQYRFRGNPWLEQGDRIYNL